jgi:hypothetical protein
MGCLPSVTLGHPLLPPHLGDEAWKLALAWLCDPYKPTSSPNSPFLLHSVNNSISNNTLDSCFSCTAFLLSWYVHCLLPIPVFDLEDAGVLRPFDSLF